MKVCVVSLNGLSALSKAYGHLYAGGAEVQLAQFAMALARLGHDVSFVVGDFGQPDGAVFECVTTVRTFKSTAGLPGLRFIYPRWTSLWAAMSRADADVYYYSCAGMVLGLLAIYCRLHQRRLVFRAASDSDCDPRTLLCTNLRDRWLYEYGLRRTDAVLVQSVTQQVAMQRNYGITSTIVRGFIERPLGDSNSRSKDIDVLWVANLRQIKRPDRFVDLAKSMPNYQFHMVGGSIPGEEAYYTQIETIAHSVPNLVFHGKVEYLEIGELFDRARLLANTSEVEGFPNTFLQAWVRGIPVATMFDPDSVVVREALGSTHDTVESMVRGIELILQSTDVYDRTRATVLAFMAQNFGQETVLKPYLAALHGVKDGAHTVNA